MIEPEIQRLPSLSVPNPRALIFAACTALAALLFAGGAAAHQQGQSYCNVTTVVGGIDVTVETSFEHLVPVLGLGSLKPQDSEILAARDRLAQQLEDHVQARTPAGPCQVASDAPILDTREGVRVAEVTLHYQCPPGPVTLRNTWRFDVDPSSETVCAIDGAAWVFRVGIEEADLGAPPTLGQVMGSFVGSGMLHVFGGIDHVLFIVALLVAAASARQESLAAGLKATAAVVTGFTLGHSVTLIGAGLDLVRLPPRLTESVIALSIVVVGVENIARKEIRWRMLTATLFGLVHGFGFATVLAETELPRRGAVWALLAFNLGIEAAQLTIVALLFPPLALAARRSWFRGGMLIPVSATVAVLASLWFVKRAAHVEFLPWLGS
jgi:HupE/UreJ protein